MTQPHRLVIRIKPLSKPRPRFSRRGGGYVPEHYHGYEDAIAAAWVASEGPFFDGPVSVTCTFRKDRITVYVKDLDAPKSKLRGDADNLAKGLADGLNGVAWGDDKQIQRFLIRKR